MADVTIADVMKAYAMDAVTYAKRHHEITLDFSEKSLEQVDRILADYAKSGLVVPDKLTPDQREEFWKFCKKFGGYIGEVIIRNLGGTWKLKDIDENSSSISLLAADRIEGSPPEAVWRALTEPYKGISTYYRGLLAILGKGERTKKGGLTFVRLPPFSGNPPEAMRKPKPWWRFW